MGVYWGGGGGGGLGSCIEGWKCYLGIIWGLFCYYEEVMG